MSGAHTEEFTVGGKTYRAARASAAQQDELLSLLTVDLIRHLAASGVKDDVSPVATVMPMLMAQPFALKEKINGLIMRRVYGSDSSDRALDMADFDDVMDFNRLRAEILVWNLRSFFKYWAENVRQGETEKKSTDN